MSTPAPAEAFELHDRLAREIAASRPLERGDPVCRRLHVFTSDPTASRLEGRSTVAEVPYEPLELREASGPRGRRYACLCGRLFELHMLDADDRALDPPRLDEPAQLMTDGYLPSESNPRFHAQMVYAVAARVHADFRRALGREPGWAFRGTHPQLKVFPLGTTEENAWYDPEAGELRFGYFRRDDLGWISTALMHDIVAHELTHALLDSQRPHFMEPVGPDVAGFHEGFADLVALFQHFQYREPLKAALAESRGVIVARKPGEQSATWLCRIARQFGAADDLDALRRADRSAETLSYKPSLEEHDMGELLLSAVFEAFDTVYRRRTQRLVTLATGGSGVLPPGALHPDLVEALADEAAGLARGFLGVIVRALDHCPPADIHLGEFLRAMITADARLVPDDRWGFREALIDAFRVRRILPRHVFSLTEDSLLWGPPRVATDPLPELSFGLTRFEDGPGRPLRPAARREQAAALGRWVTARPEVMAECGLVAPGDPALRAKGARVSRPCVDAVEATCHASPRGEVHYHTVAVVTQRCTVAAQGGKPGFAFWAGGTLLFNARGELELAVTKSALGTQRIDRRRAFLEGAVAAQAAAAAAHAAARTRGGPGDAPAAPAAAPRWVPRNGVLRLDPTWLRDYHRRERRPQPPAPGATESR